ncbi:DUF4232 domain-containing protein [Streptomyces sp. NPDC005786]|uniref:DUF4232 domain-containing protein n=1 Tax=Streptomyces sp. NPDC005786 TaxID=3154891 RepID=UPI0033D02F88
MSSLSRTTPEPFAPSHRPWGGPAAQRARRLRRCVVVPVAIASIALAAGGCGGTPASVGPSGATGSVPDASARDSESPSGGGHTSPATGTGGAGEPADQDEAGSAAASASASASPGSGAVSGARRCTADSLTMRLGRADAGAGQIYYRLTFVNKSSTACALRGFPGVSLIKRDGSMIGVPAERDGAMREQAVIDPGRTAEVTLHTLNQGIKDSGCWSPPDYLRVYPPGSKDALTLRTSLLHICGDRFTTTAVGG